MRIDVLALGQLARHHRSAETNECTSYGRRGAGARHGLRCRLRAAIRPAAPGTVRRTEPHLKLYKLCGRCRGVAYCGVAHCAEDWKRHKREDGKPPAA